MDNLITLTSNITKLSTDIKKISTKSTPREEALVTNLNTTFDKITTVIPEIEKDISVSKRVIENLVKERDVLLASKVMMTDRSEKFDNGGNKNSLDFNDFFFNEADSLKIQLKNLVKNFKDRPLSGDKMVQINALSLFILAYIKRNGENMRGKLENFYKGSHHEGQSGENKFDDLITEVQKFMRGDSKRLSAMMDSFEFKKNFNLYEQNIKLKKLNFKYNKKIKKLSKRVNLLVKKFSEFLESNRSGTGEMSSRSMYLSKTMEKMKSERVKMSPSKM